MRQHEIQGFLVEIVSRRHEFPSEAHRDVANRAGPTVTSVGASLLEHKENIRKVNSSYRIWLQFTTHHTKLINQMTSNVNSSTQEARAKAEKTAQAAGFDSHPELIKATGVLESEVTTLTGRRYADRPEGLDQFGGEESERLRVHNVEMQTSSGINEVLKKYEGNPGGVDTFGGEDTERKL
ncbi:uncharacterized protein FOMMEDRAFT_148446 [Fomitiporia mediterranea MF3/22]|uniref:uncharacterized protein n=1 Tax=Fomitiporia mediterranea (strain MF3/22) TaxID=694068 RepID=UPI0004407CCA|nr:uncharacterized protein FOMMEDRAFT_148446 [Fomitiporia mediterranea MF3/22]EJD00136.1 hypothetical protein FOMMEDRAFT_148446 [Fomitiporia mediterranea MF3/22]